MGPARRFLDAAVLVELVESGVGVGLQCAAELLQMPLGMLTFAIRRIRKPHRGRGLICCRTIIAKRRSTIVRSWSCHCLELALAPACRQHAACLLPAHSGAALPPAAPATARFR